jgi:hypothetical protein
MSFRPNMGRSVPPVQYVPSIWRQLLALEAPGYYTSTRRTCTFWTTRNVDFRLLASLCGCITGLAREGFEAAYHVFSMLLRRTELCAELTLQKVECSALLSIFRLVGVHSCLCLHVQLRSACAWSALSMFIPNPIPHYPLPLENSPLGQAQQQVPLRSLLHKARNSEPARAPVALLISGSRAYAERISHNLLAGRGVEELRRVGKAADDLHLREWTGGGRGEGAGCCAWHVLAEE